MKDDKRRIPYNIWICILSVVIILVISSIGVGIINIALEAKSKVVLSETQEVCFDCLGRTFITEYTFDDSANVKSNGALMFTSGITILIGFAVIMFGITIGTRYGRNRWWDYGEKSHNLGGF